MLSPTTAAARTGGRLPVQSAVRAATTTLKRASRVQQRHLTTPTPRTLPSLCRSLSSYPPSSLSSSSSPPPPAPPTGEAVSLAYELHSPPANTPPNAGRARSLVVAHGLFGSKQNWRSLGKSLAAQLGVPVYAVDLRDHGESPHTPRGMSYADMARDLRRFVDERGLDDVALVGHSMGGKAVMAFALDPECSQREGGEDVLSHLVSVDMSPARGKLSKEFAAYIDAMLRIEERGCKSRQEADDVLKEIEPALPIRQFLLTNLHRSPPSSPHWTFRIPVRTIKAHLAQIGDFPVEAPERSEGVSSSQDPPSSSSPRASSSLRSSSVPTLFIKGRASPYLNRHNLPLCAALFPRAQHVTLEAGHWVQAERPGEFMREVVRFVRGG